jgi:hypothetical protein
LFFSQVVIQVVRALMTYFESVMMMRVLRMVGGKGFEEGFVKEGFGEDGLVEDGLVKDGTVEDGLVDGFVKDEEGTTS